MTTSTTTITVTKRDGSTKTVETPYSDFEVIMVLRRYVTEGKIRSSFGADLADKGERYGLSEKQAAWAHILVIEAETPAPERVAVRQLDSIRGMMEHAADEGLKFQKINLTTEGGQRVRLGVAGARSKNPGRIHISNGKSYDDPGKIYHGFIDLDGGFFPRTEDKDVHDLLGTFDSDPAATASAYGRRTGRCCFCGRELTDGRSVAVGYGPICAPRYGLPWGDITISSTCEVRADMN